MQDRALITAPDGASYDADCQPGTFGGTSVLLPGLPAYRLHGRVGSAMLPLGTSAAFLAATEGVLELAINGSAEAAMQPTGSLQVTIGRGVRPAVGLSSLTAGDMPRMATATATPTGT